MNVEAKLGQNVFKLSRNSHIQLRHEVCRQQCRQRWCLSICPAKVFSWNDQRQEVHVEFEGCLECGTCMIACLPQAIQWHYPQAGFGVQYRFG